MSRQDSIVVTAEQTRLGAFPVIILEAKAQSHGHIRVPQGVLQAVVIPFRGQQDEQIPVGPVVLEVPQLCKDADIRIVVRIHDGPKPVLPDVQPKLLDGS